VVSRDRAQKYCSGPATGGTLGRTGIVLNALKIGNRPNKETKHSFIKRKMIDVGAVLRSGILAAVRG
jgi:hypothetical protein